MNRKTLARINFNKKLAAFIAFFSTAGLILLIVTLAANITANLEAESGNISNQASAFSDSTASSGSALRFGSGPIPTDSYRGEYFANINLSGAPALVRNDSSIDFDWGEGSPGSGLPVDDFSVRWTRNAEFENGTYRFTVTVDDGVRLYIDDDLIIDEWFQQSATTYTAEKTLSAGSHTVKFEYYDLIKHAVANLSYELVDSPQDPPPTACSGTYGAGSGASTRGPTTYNSSGTTTVSNVIFDGSHSDDLVRVYNGKVIFENVTFKGNGTGSSGHSLEVKQGGSVEVRNSRFNGSPSEDTIQFEGNGTSIVECNRIASNPGEDHIDTKPGGEVTIRENNFASSATAQTIQNHNSQNPVHLISNNGTQDVFYEDGQTGGTIINNDISGSLWMYDVARILVEDSDVNLVKHGEGSSDRDPAATYFLNSNIGTFQFNGGSCYKTGVSGASLSQCSNGSPSWY